MAQITSRVSDELENALNRWASEDGRQRSDLVREILTEAADARRDGRAMFDRPADVGPGDVVAMKAMLDQGLMEIDRIARTWAAHEATLLKLEREDQELVRRARTEAAANLPETLAASLKPFQTGLAALAARIDKQPRLDAIDEKLREHGDLLRDNTAAIDRLRQEPRTVSVYPVFGQDWSGRMVASALFVIGTLSVGVFLILAVLLPRSWVALPVANRLLGGGDQAVCQLVNYRMATDSCRTQFEGRAAKAVVATLPKANGR